jgi:hypothetical protein
MCVKAILRTKQRFAAFVGTGYRVLIVKCSVAKSTNPTQVGKITITKILSSVSFFFEPSYA